MAKKKHRRSPEQLKIAGTERLDRVPEIESLAEQYRDLDDQHKGLGEAKVEVAEELVEKMQALGRERYVYEDRAGQLQEISIAELTVKVTVRRVRKPADTSTPTPASN